MSVSRESINRFIGTGNPLAAAGGADTLLRATGGSLYGAALLAAIAKKESSFGATAGRYKNNFWGWGVHLGPGVYTSPTVEAGASKVWRGLNSGLYKGAGLTDAASIIRKYAPPSENNTALYQQQVNSWLQQLGLAPNTNVFTGTKLANIPGGIAGAGSQPSQPGQVAQNNTIPADNRLSLLSTLRQLHAPGMGGLARLSLLEQLKGASMGAAGQAGAPAGPPAAAGGGGGGGLSFGDGIIGADGKIIGTPYSGTHTIGNWQSDNAIDIAAKVGTPVYSVTRGTIDSRFGSLGSGNPRFAGLRLTVDAGPRNSAYYAHLSRFAPGIRPGVQVRPGQLLGYTGSANGVGHLHFGVEGGDPRRFIRSTTGR